MYFTKEADSDQPFLLSAIAHLLKSYRSVQCVVLNACESVKNINFPLAEITIGMDKAVDDNVAIDFACGFYRALKAGKNFEEVYELGRSSVLLKGGDGDLLRLMKTEA